MDAAARIGPNAVTRLAEALAAECGPGGAATVFARAGLERYLEHPPEHMVDEREVALLHRRLRETLDRDTARRIGREAGRRTGDYLLLHRIPRPAQWLLKRLPPALASRMLLAAISRHAWTFAGSGRFTVRHGTPLRLGIAGNPLCRGVVAEAPLCDYYAATFERLYRALVHPATEVREVACEAMGAPSCVFELRWNGPAAAAARAAGG